MTHFERRFLARTARYGTLIMAGLTWLVLAVYGSRRLDSLENLHTFSLPARDLAFLLRFLEVALALAAVIAIGLAVSDLRRHGILTSFLTAGMGTRRILRPVMIVAAIVLLATVALHEGIHEAEARAAGGPQPRVWKHDGVWIWAPRGWVQEAAPEGIILFASHDLAVSGVNRATRIPRTRSYSTEDATPLAGLGITIAEFAAPPSTPDPFGPVSIGALLQSPTPLRDTVAAIDRIALAPLLVVVAAYAVLLGATRRPAGLACLALSIPILALLDALSVRLLFRSPASGLIAQIVWTAAALTVTVGPVILVHRRGPVVR